MAHRTAIVHIGSPKTGTTSIQRTLNANREALKAAGFAYSEAAGGVSHTRLAAFMRASVGARASRLQRKSGPAGNFAAAVQEEVAALPEQVRTVIFSSEHLFNSGLQPGAVENLRALFAPMFESFRVVAYLRRQDELAVSLLSTRLKAGRVLSEPFPATPSARGGFNYVNVLAPWVATFGKANVTPRVFSRNELTGGDVVKDFCALCGIPELEQGPAEANASLTPAAQEYLLRINRPPAVPGTKVRRVAKAAWRPPTYLRTFLTNNFGGGGQLPSRAEAVAFYANFVESNEQVRADFFPERPRLFHDRFDRYPETPADPTAEEVLEVALAVNRMQLERIAESQADRALAIAAKAQAKGRPGDRFAACMQALEAEPTHKRALREAVAAVANPADAERLRRFFGTTKVSARKIAGFEAEWTSRFAGAPAEAPPPRVDAAARTERRARRKATAEARAGTLVSAAPAEG